MPIASQYKTCYSTAMVSFNPICHHLKDIHCRDMHDLDLDLWNWPRSNVNMPNESRYMTLFDVTSNCYPIWHHFQDIDCWNVPWSWPWPLESAKVKCKYTSRKPLYDFSIIVNSNFYHICHRFRDNHIWTVEILPTSVFDLETEGQNHEKQHRRLHIGCQINSPKIRWKWQIYLEPYSFCAVH